MAKADSEKLLKRIEKFVGQEVRKKVAGQYTRVTFTAEGVGQGIKEGYQALQERLGDEYLPIDDADFTNKIGSKAIYSVYFWAANDKTTPHEVEEYTPGVSVTYLARRDVGRPYTLAKNAAVKELQKIRKIAGKRELLGKTEQDKTASQSELGIVKTRVHKLHKGVTTVGAAQLSAAMSYLERTKDFNGFTSSEAVKDLMEYYKQVKLVWSASGTKKSGLSSVSLNENLYVEMVVSSMSDNPAGGEPFDWKNIRPVLEQAIEKYLIEANLADQKGSKSIRQNALDMTEHVVVANLTAGKRVRATKKTSASNRNKSNVDTSTRGKRRKPKKSTKKTATTRVYSKSPASVPLELISLLNRDLPSMVAANMDTPALENRTGRFASSVKITDIMQTPQGFPSIGYTYMKDPYQTFEPGHRQGSVDRDPRKLIDRSIRELAAQYAIGRFYTRRV
jgi:hypothetical protein